MIISTMTTSKIGKGWSKGLRYTIDETTCDYCGKKFHKSQSYLKRKHINNFCSTKCRGKFMSAQFADKLLFNKCLYCGKLFHVFPSKIDRSKYCSRDCASAGRQLGDKVIICKTCGKKFIVGINKDRKYCSNKCYSTSKIKPIESKTKEVLCPVCGKIFRARNSQVKLGYGKYCSERCFGKMITQTRKGNHYKTTHGGKREDLNNEYFRSGWEANYARYLNWLVSLGEIKSWEFEPETFEFEKIRKGTRFYTPDFKIANNDGSVEYHEIKGFMDQKSQTKMKRMSKYYPNIKLILIDRSAYYAIARQVRNIIPNWETDKKHSI